MNLDVRAFPRPRGPRPANPGSRGWRYLRGVSETQTVPAHFVALHSAASTAQQRYKLPLDQVAPGERAMLEAEVRTTLKNSRYDSNPGHSLSNPPTQSVTVADLERMRTAPMHKIDYILCSPKLLEKMIGGGILRKGVWGGKNGDLFPHYDTITKAEEAASDHAAIWGEFDL